MESGDYFFNQVSHLRKLWNTGVRALLVLDNRAACLECVRNLRNVSLIHPLEVSVFASYSRKFLNEPPYKSYEEIDRSPTICFINDIITQER